MSGDDLVQAAWGISSATLHEAAGRTGNLPSSIKPLAPDQVVWGRAFPVRSPVGDNLFLHHAIYAARPGDVLVVDCGQGSDFGYWGEVMAVAALAVGLAGLVISGGVRDSQRMVELGFPVFSGDVSIRGTLKDPSRGGSIGAPIMMGEVTVRKGDLVVGDCDGVIVLPQECAAEAIALGRERDTKEQDIFRRLKAGERTIEIFGLPSVASQS